MNFNPNEGKEGRKQWSKKLTFEHMGVEQSLQFVFRKLLVMFRDEEIVRTSEKGNTEHGDKGHVTVLLKYDDWNSS